ncbi:MAG: putative DNA-binding domain-containing protein [Myxococcales bacterium]|nr:putative DNA-binding domain-containing protein [Myxococcales bacterium]
MSLAEDQAAILRICFARKPEPADLARLGSAERWQLYRSMVRERLRKLCLSALPRTAKALGEAGFAEAFDAWLADGGPRSRFFWRLPLEFAAHLSASGLSSRPMHRALGIYEAELWRVRHELEKEPPETCPLEFERPIALNPTLRQLRLTHAVLAEPDERGEIPERPTELALFRSLDDLGTRTWTLSPIAAALLERWRSEPTESLTRSVQEVTRARGAAIDAPFLESLGALLAELHQRGLILGSLADRG